MLSGATWDCFFKLAKQRSIRGRHTENRSHNKTHSKRLVSVSKFPKAKIRSLVPMLGVQYNHSNTIGDLEFFVTRFIYPEIRLQGQEKSHRERWPCCPMNIFSREGVSSDMWSRLDRLGREKRLDTTKVGECVKFIVGFLMLKILGLLSWPSWAFEKHHTCYGFEASRVPDRLVLGLWVSSN